MKINRIKIIFMNERNESINVYTNKDIVVDVVGIYGRLGWYLRDVEPVFM